MEAQLLPKSSSLCLSLVAAASSIEVVLNGEGMEKLRSELV